MNKEDVKVGMMVRCIVDFFDSIEKDGVYTVLGINAAGFDIGKQCEYGAMYFEPVDECSSYASQTSEESPKEDCYRIKKCWDENTNGKSPLNQCEDCDRHKPTASDSPKPSAKFKVGDMVRRVPYTEDSIYTVSKITVDEITVRRDEGDKYIYPLNDGITRFELVEEQETYTHTFIETDLRDLMGLDYSGFSTKTEKEVNKLDEDIEKQLKIKQVGSENGNIILKDGRIGRVISADVSVTITEEDYRALVLQKLPKTVTDRAMVIPDSTLRFTTYQFEELTDDDSDDEDNED